MDATRTAPERESAATRIQRLAAQVGSLAEAEARDTSRAAGAPSHDADPVSVCRRYWRAIAAHDVESLLDAMTPEYGAQLRELRRQPDFSAFFLLWCEAQGRLRSVLSNSLGGDHANVVLAVDTCRVHVALCRRGGQWLIESERVAR